MNRFIPVNEPLLDGNEKKYLTECIDTGWISSEGPFVQRLEAEFAQRVDRKFGVAVCNGSAALDAAVAALKIQPGDEVILPSFTIISCAASIVRAGATPVVVDSDPNTWNMDVTQIERRITPHTRAIMAVHIFGLPTDMDVVQGLAEKYHLAVIEDAAEVIGLNYNGRPCGSFGDLSTFSFYPNKHLTTGEGGMIVTDDPALAERCRSLRNLCFQAKQRFVHEELGWNLRMSNLQAAVGCAQLERLDYFVAHKHKMAHIIRLYSQTSPACNCRFPRFLTLKTYIGFMVLCCAMKFHLTPRRRCGGLQQRVWERARSFGRCMSSPYSGAWGCLKASRIPAPNGWRDAGFMCRAGLRLPRTRCSA